MSKLVFCNNVSANLMQNTVGSFLHQSLFSKIHYKHEICSEEFLLMYSEYLLQAQNELKIINIYFFNFRTINVQVIFRFLNNIVK